MEGIRFAAWIPSVFPYILNAYFQVYLAKNLNYVNSLLKHSFCQILFTCIKIQSSVHNVYLLRVQSPASIPWENFRVPCTPMLAFIRLLLPGLSWCSFSNLFFARLRVTEEETSVLDFCFPPFLEILLCILSRIYTTPPSKCRWIMSVNGKMFFHPFSHLYI